MIRPLSFHDVRKLGYERAAQYNALLYAERVTALKGTPQQPASPQGQHQALKARIAKALAARTGPRHPLGFDVARVVLEKFSETQEPQGVVQLDPAPGLSLVPFGEGPTTLPAGLDAAISSPHEPSGLAAQGHWRPSGTLNEGHYDGPPATAGGGHANRDAQRLQYARDLKAKARELVREGRARNLVEATAQAAQALGMITP